MTLYSQADIAAAASRVRANVERVIVGKSDIIDQLMIALLVEGHVLIEDVPGVGKTTLARALARSLDCSFRRIQFTPDLLPSDVVGINFFNQKSQEFEYRAGPIVAQIVLADEINRATPRTQSALLEAMQERTVTVDGETMALPRPFMVLATQNPIELEGTFALPEAQMDRFVMRIRLGYPSVAEEEDILLRFEHDDPMVTLSSVLPAEDMLALAQARRSVRVEATVRNYIVRIVQSTRAHSAVELGASPRGSLALYQTAQARAAIQGRDYVLPDDIKALAAPVLTHRLILSSQMKLRGRSPEQILQEIVEAVPAPVDTPA
ncbi:MAG: MoxR family ATPase [Anaerolineae bacterium]